MELTERIQRTCGHWETVTVEWPVGRKPNGKMLLKKAALDDCAECVEAKAEARRKRTA